MIKKRILTILIAGAIIGSTMFAVADAKTKVLKTVGKEVVTEQEFDELLNALTGQYKEFYSTEEGKKLLLDKLVEQKIFVQEAKNKKLDKTEKFKKNMKKIVENELADMFIKQEILESVKVEEKDLKNEYETNKENYKIEEQVKASHILIIIGEESTEEKKIEAKAKAEEILKEVLEGKISFEELAKKYSDDKGSGENGGDLGYFSKQDMVNEFADAAFAGESGKVIPALVETQYGYHIIKVSDKKTAGYKSFEEVKSEIEEFILDKKRTEKYEKMMAELKKKYKVK
jgi:peptidyl-prolyl cis-trans isomerase C